jgi:chloride channel 3/4/5
MSLRGKRSVNSLFKRDSADDTDAPPTDAGSGPASTTWRRQRLLDIGEDERSTPQLGEGSSLRRKGPSASYGTLPSHSPARSRFTGRIALPSRQSSDTHSLPGQSSALVSPTMRSFPGRTSMYFGAERPIAAYDAPLLKDIQRTAAEPISAQVNGLRVWYASFTSIDWLHDAIKDGVRRARRP